MQVDHLIAELTDKTHNQILIQLKKQEEKKEEVEKNGKKKY